MNKQRLEYISRLLLGALSAVALLSLTMEYVLPVAMPFLIAWSVAFVVREPAEWICARTRLPKAMVRPTLAILLTLSVFALISLFVYKCSNVIMLILGDIAEGNNPIYDAIISITDPNLPIFGDSLSEELAERIAEAIGGLITSLFTGLASFVTSLVSALPNVLLFLLATVIALIYFAIDLEKINARVRSFLPERLSDRLTRIRHDFFSTAGKYIFSYLIIMVVTFAVLLTGFFILGVDNAPTFAILISLLDLLPVIGVGTVLVPWGILSLISGDNFLGAGLILLFVVNTVIRELIEPKIVGKSLDMHPLLTLILIYVGYALFGLQGLILVPVLSVLFGTLFNNGDSAKIDEPASK